jgi:hypothetical protein
LAVHANLFRAATITAGVITVDSRRTDALVVDADHFAQATAAEERGFLATALGWNRTTLGAAPVAGACVFLATTNEILSVRAADRSLRAAATLDRPVTAVRQGAALDRNAERGEFADYLIAGLGRALGLLRIVATAVAAPAEVASGAVGRLTTAEEAVWNGKGASAKDDEAEYQEKAKTHQNVPFTEMPVGPMLTSGSASS